MREFKDSEEVVLVVIKYVNLCGVGLGKDVFEVYIKCYEVDKVLIFGGIVGIIFIIDKVIVEKLNEIFLEIVVVYDFELEVLEIFK